MKLALFLVALATVYCSKDHAPPKVQVYTSSPGKYGRENTLLCHVSGFHPPDINIQVMKNGEEFPDSRQTDLAFIKNWKFHLNKRVAFTPLRGEDYSCRVTHGLDRKEYAWEPDM
ncbi:beta-2-microglobulin-like [Brachionichthys hirsutus]|uniref:beta-2-microglobulin-like n=1 Tax=Brachionichthys hirsutus TaxID=412623 RepID=UPI003604ED3D